MSCRKKLPKSTKEMSQEQLLDILKKKRECNTRALRIVEAMTEGGVDKNWMLKNLFFINQCHYDDIVTERSILKLCGYPLCENLLENVPKQQYRISLNNQTVYDMTERKNFCSNRCYKASQYLKNQLLTSPLWFREDSSIPNFHTLPENSMFSPSKTELAETSVVEEEWSENKRIVETIEGGGKEEVLADKKEIVETLADADKKENVLADKKNIVENVIEISTKEKVLTENGEIVGKVAEGGTKEEVLSNNKQIVSAEDSTKKQEGYPTENEQVKDVEEARSSRKESTPTKLIANPVLVVEKALEEWFTVRTYVHLFGEEKLKSEFAGKEELVKSAMEKQSSLSSSAKKFEDISRLLSILEIRSEREEEEEKELKPLPDYSMLKVEAEDLNIKVRAFYTGQLELVRETVKKIADDADADSEIQGDIPLVDCHAQTALRRKVLLDRLNRIIPDLCISLGIANYVTVTDIRLLVHTFELSAHNITFRPREWFLVGTIIIKLLTSKIEALQHCLQEVETRKKLTLLLLSYNLNEDYLDNFLEWVSDVERLCKTLECQQ